VRVALKIFYRTKMSVNAELQLFIVSAVSWIIGNSLLRGHEWQTQDLYLQPEMYKSEALEDKGTYGMSLVTRVCLDLLRKII
jgi:hypothetical protein